MSWETFWAVIFFLTLFGFVAISLLISWKGVADLRALFSTLKQQSQESPIVSAKH